MVTKILVELYVNGVLFESVKAEEKRLHYYICLFRQMGTVKSDGSIWEIFIYKNSINQRKKLDNGIQKLFDAAIAKHYTNTDYGITTSDHDKLRPVKRKLKNTRVDLNKV